MKLQGSFVALVTPYSKGEVDLPKVRELVEFHVKNGTSGICPVATTGAGPVLTHDEKVAIVKTVVETAKGKALVFPGTGTYNTAESIELTKMAQELGADGALMVTPYYNKPTQEGLYQHFKAVNDAVGIPIFIYNIPPRSVIDMSVATMARLYELKNIVGVKDATANIGRVSQQRQAMGPEFVQLSGEDMTALAYNAAGGNGCISVVANVAPRLCAELQETSLSGDYAGALKVQDRLVPLHDAIFVEPGLAGAKCGLALLGRGGEEIRLPMLPVTAPTKAAIRKAMVHAGLINA
ncbi:MAG: 4-hydroxy-tetrahydrodipicolinate synthase [Microvirga sp.]